jgi:hypothetical protein
VSARDRCGYALEDKDGEQYPCDRPATGWRWYQDVGDHEDLLDVACDHHANEGGRLIAQLKADLERARTIAVALEQQVALVATTVAIWQDELDTGKIRDPNARFCWELAASEIRRALDPELGQS